MYTCPYSDEKSVDFGKYFSFSQNTLSYISVAVWISTYYLFHLCFCFEINRMWFNLFQSNWFRESDTYGSYISKGPREKHLGESVSKAKHFFQQNKPSQVVHKMSCLFALGIQVSKTFSLLRFNVLAERKLLPAFLVETRNACSRHMLQLYFSCVKGHNSIVTKSMIASNYTT